MCPKQMITLNLNEKASGVFLHTYVEYLYVQIYVHISHKMMNYLRFYDFGTIEVVFFNTNLVSSMAYEVAKINAHDKSNHKSK